MQKIQVQAEIQVQSLLAQLDTDALEEVVREAAALLTQRRSDDPQLQETKLLQQLNEECALPEAHWSSLRALLQKRAQQPLSESEQAQLDALIQEEEVVRWRRVQILGELAQLKGVSLEELTEALGIAPVEETGYDG